MVMITDMSKFEIFPLFDDNHCHKLLSEEDCQKRHYMKKL